ncbi:hypothetical protein LIER_28008 [Lithospermum erythrorhizon]|uniref:Uncharacterized protein n=1 Tax=Lithospermum erythrorhizon TaxID=34254 RepID=A0AAV3RED7_LITER
MSTELSSQATILGSKSNSQKSDAEASVDKKTNSIEEKGHGVNIVNAMATFEQVARNSMGIRRIGHE